MEIILGPPGTGKTKTLMDRVLAEMERGTPPDRIGYLAFTKRAAEEAVNRAQSRFSLTSKDMPFFRTIHSLAFRQLGLSRKAMMTEDHYRDLGKWLGVEMTGKAARDGETWGSVTGDRILHLIGRARVKCVDIVKEYEQSGEKGFTPDTLMYINRGLEKYKDTHDLRDFTDLLFEFYERGTAPYLEAILVDEGQDLSNVQWKVISWLQKHSKARIYVAGDDDQAIFRWAGADVEHFIDMPGEVTLLKQSYRVPKTVRPIAVRLVAGIKHRRKKIWMPRDEDGSVRNVLDFRNIQELDMSNGEWLVLTRNRYHLGGVRRYCRDRGWYHSWMGFPSIKRAIMSGIVGYQKWVRTKDEEGWALGRKFINKGLWDQLRNTEDPPPWFEVMEGIPEDDETYIRAVLRHGEDLGKPPRIRLSTIHSAKGAEADNVVLLTEVLGRTRKQWEDGGMDDERRVFFVGVTRVKQNLFVVHARGNKGFHISTS